MPDGITDSTRARWFEDFRLGETFETASMEVTEDMILAFARDYDPQPFHLNREAAERSHYGGLIASGYQTAAISFRLFVDTGVLRACGMGGPGIESLRWHRPVRPGDRLRVRVTVASLRASDSRKDRGYVDFDFETFNQDGALVASHRLHNILARRPD